MIYIKHKLTLNELGRIYRAITEIEDEYQDFYLTIDNRRVSIKNTFKNLQKNLKKGDIIAFDEKANAVAMIVGIAEKADRKYLKILARNIHSADRVLQVLFWNYNEEVFVKLKKSNPLLRLLLGRKFGFVFFGSRGKELLIKRSKNDKPIFIKSYKDRS